MKDAVIAMLLTILLASTVALHVRVERLAHEAEIFQLIVKASLLLRQ